MRKSTRPSSTVEYHTRPLYTLETLRRMWGPKTVEFMSLDLYSHCCRGGYYEGMIDSSSSLSSYSNSTIDFRPLIMMQMGKETKQKQI